MGLILEHKNSSFGKKKPSDDTLENAYREHYTEKHTLSQLRCYVTKKN